MPDFVIQDIKAVLKSRTKPTITMWNRLEARPRTHDFDRALRAEVRDPMWMLCRQWQMGEFLGDDAGSPVTARILIDHTSLDKYQPAGKTTQHFPDEVPLEGLVERRAVSFQRGNQEISLDLRLMMGRHWLKLINGIGAYRDNYIEVYNIEVPSHEDAHGAEVCAHQDSWQHFAAVAGRKMDGAKLYFYLKGDASRHAYDELTIAVNPADHSDLDNRAQQFIEFFERLIYQPPNDGEDAWIPDRLEYQCAVSTPDENGGEQVLQAEEYYHNRLDWFNFDYNPSHNGLGTPAGPAPPVGPPQVPSRLEDFLPTPVEFDGMPHTRWWTFEEGKTNFGDINPATTDLAKLLFIEFGLVYANDWFMLPHELPVGTLSRVKGLTVTNVFGERFWISASGSGQDDDWQRWNMYSLSIKGNNGEAADNGLLLLPTVPKIQESEMKESVVLIRDEMANMVWGVETQVPLANGQIKRGSEAGNETFNFHQRLIGEPGNEAPNPQVAPVRYKVMNTVPENWIPFIPVHKENDVRNTRLQRAAMPRILEGDTLTPVKVRPKTSLLRQGMDIAPPDAYYLNEEEVPRAGVVVTQAFQRTRWYGGRVYTWLGVAKNTGRGEGSSGLAFDQLV